MEYWEELDYEEEPDEKEFPLDLKIREYKKYVGKSVRLRPDSRWIGKNNNMNPPDVDGEIVGFRIADKKLLDMKLDKHDLKLIFEVRWSNGILNQYNPDDLYYYE